MQRHSREGLKPGKMPDIRCKNKQQTNRSLYTAGVAKAGPAPLRVVTWRDMDRPQEKDMTIPVT